MATTITKIQLRRGSTADRQSVTLAVGEPGWDTTENALYIGDGATAGGIKVGTEAGGNIQFSDVNARVISPWNTNSVTVSSATYNNPILWVKGTGPALIVGDGDPVAGTSKHHLFFHIRNDHVGLDGGYIDYKHTDEAVEANAGNLNIRCHRMEGTTHKFATVMKFTSAGSLIRQEGDVTFAHCRQFTVRNLDDTFGSACWIAASGGNGAGNLFYGGIGQQVLSGGGFHSRNTNFYNAQHSYDIGAWNGYLILGDISPVADSNNYLAGGVSMRRWWTNRQKTGTLHSGPSGVREVHGSAYLRHPACSGHADAAACGLRNGELYIDISPEGKGALKCYITEYQNKLENMRQGP